MTLFKVWGWIYFVSAVLMTLANFGKAFNAEEGNDRRSAAVGFVVSGVSAWWVFTALQMAR